MEDNLVNDSWDDIDLSDLTEEVSEDPAVEEGEGAEAPKADQPTEVETRSEDGFTLKWMGEEKSYTREEVIPLAQKGIDYDRVKGQLEESRQKYADYDTIKADLAKRNEQFRYLEEIAKEQNQTLDELIELTQAQMMAKKTGQNIDVCRGIVKNQRLERELKARQSEQPADDPTAKIRAHVEEFLRAYPDYDPKDMKTLPPEVWAAVDKGESLLSAYRAYEVKELKAQLERQKAEAEQRLQKEINKSRSTGSQSTKGKETVDPFDADWYNGT